MQSHNLALSASHEAQNDHPVVGVEEAHSGWWEIVGKERHLPILLHVQRQGRPALTPILSCVQDAVRRQDVSFAGRPQRDRRDILCSCAFGQRHLLPGLAAIRGSFERETAIDPSCLCVYKAYHATGAAWDFGAFPGLPAILAHHGLNAGALPDGLDIHDVQTEDSAIAAFSHRPGLASIGGVARFARSERSHSEAGGLIEKRNHPHWVTDPCLEHDFPRAGIFRWRWHYRISW